MITSAQLRTMRVGLKINTEPATDVINKTEAKQFLRICDSEDDNLIEACVDASIKLVEKNTGRKLINQTWNMWLDMFPGDGLSSDWWPGTRQGPIDALNGGASRVIDLPFAPVQSITSLTTYNTANTSSVFSSANYILDSANEPGRIILDEGQTWPTDLRDHNAIDIEMVFGYGSAASAIPKPLIKACYQLTAWFYENRGDCEGMAMPMITQAIIDNYKVHMI